MTTLSRSIRTAGLALVALAFGASQSAAQAEGAIEGRVLEAGRAARPAASA